MVFEKENHIEKLNYKKGREAAVLLWKQKKETISSKVEERTKTETTTVSVERITRAAKAVRHVHVSSR